MALHDHHRQGGEVPSCCPGEPWESGLIVLGATGSADPRAFRREPPEPGMGSPLLGPVELGILAVFVGLVNDPLACTYRWQCALR